MTAVVAMAVHNLSFMLWFVIAFSAGQRTLFQWPPSLGNTEYWVAAAFVVALWLLQGLLFARVGWLVLVSLSLAAFVPIKVMLGGQGEVYASYLPFSIAGALLALVFGQLGRRLRRKLRTLRPPMPPALAA
ncbi:MAG: hypothetical protein NTV70_00420 [Acidobacteria bacterium]|nr:hypothetical protein [Acidobacteriota bacterium]